MTVYNSTYNFNQGNMNFGQALLYGAFGSLTGGMGMGGCFGGFGSPFSMGGSLFSMPGIGMGGCFGGFGFGGYSDSFAGMQIGTALSGIVLGTVSKAIEGRGAAKAEREEKLNTAKNNINTLNTEIDELKEQNKGLDPAIVDGKVTSSASKACSAEADAYTAAKQLYDDFVKDGIDKYTDDTVKGYEKELEELKKASPVDSAKVNAKEKQIKEAKEDGYNKKSEKLKEAVDQAEQKLILAAKTKYQENERLITAKEKELAKANEELEAAAGEQVKVSRKCDTKEEYESIVGTNNAEKDCNPENVKDFVRAFNFKFSQYCKASSSDKKATAEEAIKVYKKINDKFPNSITSEMTRNMKIMQSYIDKDGKQHGI